MSAAIRRLERQITDYWKIAARFDGTPEQWSEWRVVKQFCYGFESGCDTKGAREVAYFLAELARERGSLE
jgi:hypothetical protein